MQVFATIMGLALAATGVSAQNAFVNNNCPGTIYVQSFPYDGSAAGPLTTVTTGSNFTEVFRPSGSTIKIATTKTFDAPLFFGYSFSTNPDYVYYEFSTQWGNPFAASHDILTAGDGCMVFDCAPNDTACYSTSTAKKVFGCPQPVNLTATVCA
ncbi:hypothetical protein GGR50DRAFT_83741 [Xylaria sp. CBS 124048]|nr:hypothetical protein GGR50DRAFT_83741 [Xylaria sp. CBS 124048]